MQINNKCFFLVKTVHVIVMEYQREKASDDFDEHCIVSHGNGCDQCQIIISEKIATILVLSAINIRVMLVCFIKIFKCKDGYTRVYDTDC